jgi:hypothetical protein
MTVGRIWNELIPNAERPGLSQTLFIESAMVEDVYGNKKPLEASGIGH